MNLKRLSQRLSPAGFVLALGLIISPESVSAKVLESIPTDNETLHQPTLLINSAEQVSLLTESSSSSNLNSEESFKVANISKTFSSNGDLENNSHSSPVATPVADEQLATSANSFTSANKFMIADNSISQERVAQSSPMPTQSISIPVEVETPQSASETTAVNIPVIPSVPESNFKPQTESNPSNVIKLEVEKPSLMSNEYSSGNNSLSRARTENVRVMSAMPQESADNTSENSNVVSIVPIQIEYYNPAVGPAVGDMGYPNLPQINSPAPYLPDSQKPFNGYIWPAKGVFTSGYGWRWGRMHRGIDIAAPVGTPIFAAADGEVVFSGWNSGGYGNLVKIRHSDGSMTFYAHNSKLLVRAGQYVTQGQQIARMGSTGFSTGPHLHFEIHPYGTKAVDPIAFLPARR